MSIHIKTFFSFLITILLAALFFETTLAQEVTQEELQRAVEIREKLILDGFLEPKSEFPPPQLNAQFLLEDAWYTQKKLDLATFSSRASHFSPDGESFYILGRSERHIVEYRLDEPWEINTAEYVRELDISEEMSRTEDRPTAPHGLYLRDDGRKLWVLNRTEIWEYTLSDSWNITSAEPVARQDLIDNVVRGHDFEFKPDGSVLYVDDRIIGAIFQYNLAEDWDVTSLNLDYVLDISDEQQAVRGTNIRESGRKMFLMDTNRQEVLEYNIASPYDLRSASYSGAFSVASEASSPEGLYVKPDSRSFYVTANFDDQVHQYKISEIDAGESSVNLSEAEVEADGSEFSEVRVIVRDGDGDHFPGVEVDLIIQGGSPNVQIVENITNGDGRARFRLRNTKAEIVQVTAIASINGKEYTVTDQPEISFVPPAPVVLSATDEGTRSFTANWEMVEIASSYTIDVAEDREFETFAEGFQGFNVGNNTSYTVNNLNPGEDYYYRVRAISDGIKGNRSRTEEVILFPETPIAENPENVAATNFIASWSVAEGATRYIIDVAADENFETIVDQFDSRNVGDVTNFQVNALSPGTSYFYRVKSSSLNRESNFSNVVSLSTLEIDTERSELTSSQLRVLANGEQNNVVTIRLKTPDGNPIQGENIVLTPLSGSSEIEIIENVTDETGTAQFSVTNTVAETVNYDVKISDVFELGNITLEFLPQSDQLTLGANYPNPFQSQTFIPLSVPNTMNIKIILSNVSGSRVKTIVDEQFGEGYYEVPVYMNGLASGTYFYRLITDQKTDTRKMMLVN